MQQTDAVQAGLAYIEENLKADIRISDLAAHCHYSPWHYRALFSRAVGFSVAAYILKRRLERALMEVAAGKTAAEVVGAYGFDTYAGFYKAFVRMYGCSPKKYLSIYRTYEPKRMEERHMLTKPELQAALSHWEAARGKTISDYLIMNRTQVSTDTWRVGKDMVLRTGPRERLLKDIAASKAAAAQGLAAAVPIPTDEGAEFLDGPEIFLLTKTVPGESLTTEERTGENRHAFGLAYGRAIARMHRALCAVEGELLPDEADLLGSVKGWALPEVRRQNEQWSMGLPEEFFDEYQAQIDALLPKLPRQLIHRNPHPGNILFEDGAVTGFLEYEMYERNVRLWDPCYCGTGLLSELPPSLWERWPLLFAGIVRGYDAEEGLTAEEKAAVFPVVFSIQMICIAWFEKTEGLEELAKTNREMLRFLIEKRAETEQLMWENCGF